MSAVPSGAWDREHPESRDGIDSQPGKEPTASRRFGKGEAFTIPAAIRAWDGMAKLCSLGLLGNTKPEALLRSSFSRARRPKRSFGDVRSQAGAWDREHPESRDGIDWDGTEDRTHIKEEPTASRRFGKGGAFTIPAALRAWDGIELQPSAHSGAWGRTAKTPTSAAPTTPAAPGTSSRRNRRLTRPQCAFIFIFAGASQSLTLRVDPRPLTSGACLEPNSLRCRDSDSARFRRGAC